MIEQQFFTEISLRALALKNFLFLDLDQFILFRFWLIFTKN